MSYSVKEIYYTLQGEGANTGRPAVFVRFAGCNLWTGIEKDRGQGPGGCSRWCDTNFVGTDGPGGGKFRTADELVAAIIAQWPTAARGSRPFAVATGGEPMLQLDPALLSGLERAGFSLAVETNGTVNPPPGDYWITVSPKAGSTLKVLMGNELKLVYPQQGAEPERFESLDFGLFYLQPMDGADREQNTLRALEYCLAHPQWRLSIQSHKYLNIP